MISDVMTWAAIVGAGASSIAVIKFWKERGAAEAAIVRTVTRVDALTEDLNTFKLFVSREFPSVNDFTALEGRFTEAVEGMREDIRHMRTGMDTLVSTLLNMK